MATRDSGYNRAGITSDDSVPITATKGVVPVEFSEILWYLTAADEADGATVTPWYKKGDDYHKGTSQVLTGSSVVIGYSLGRESFLQLTGVSGTWQVRADLIEKTA